MLWLYVLLCCFSLSRIAITASICGHVSADGGILHEAMVTQQWVSQLTPEKRQTYLAASRLRRKFGDEAIIHAFDPDVIELLVFSGADVNQREASTGKTLLHVAAFKGDTDIITWLAQDEVVNFDMKDNDNKTALDIAFQNRLLDAFDLLAKSGAKVMGYKQDYDGNSPLHLAVSRNNVGFVSTIVQYDLVDLKIRNHAGETALHTAVKNTFHRFDSNIFSTVAQCRDMNVMNIKDNAGNTILHVAATQNYFDFNPVESLIDCIFVNHNAKNNNGNTALHLATQFARVDTIKILLRHKSILNCDLKNNEELTARDIANRSGDQSVITIFNEAFPEP